MTQHGCALGEVGHTWHQSGTNRSFHWKMLLVAERAFRRIKHSELMPAVYRGAIFADGKQVSREVAA